MCGTDNLLLKLVKKDLCAINEASKNGSIQMKFKTQCFNHIKQNKNHNNRWKLKKISTFA